MKQHCYLNCAASVWPRPQQVTEAVLRAMTQPPAEPSRSSSSAASPADACRHGLASLLGCAEEELFFTSGATESANLIISGLDLEGAHVIATASEHNCVLRPLYNHPSHPAVSIAPCDEDGRVILSELEALIRPETRYLFLNHCSNVTGCLQDLPKISRLVRAHGIRLIADVSQSIGIFPIDARDADILFFAGHKNLFGPTGIGGFCLRGGMPLKITKTGGTGSDSLWLKLPDGYRGREPGTPNLHGLAGLSAGVDHIRGIGTDMICASLRQRREALVSALSAIRGVRVFHPAAEEPAAPIVSFLCEGLTPSDLSYILAESYGITLRSGYHCCPLLSDCLHAPLGTARASFSLLTPTEDLERLTEAVREIMEGIA
ncbi:MAG: aminotransferase class V-fold PLP-dependent enzyme [Oscillospiraceae bacterium]|nr:aminotransferase class V-fold PLP-dependent enzyme [Oscillospiraceae bacterium]